eukprot:scaffold22293_cov31-Tisochrysis_lutea.AAC.1
MLSYTGPLRLVRLASRAPGKLPPVSRLVLRFSAGAYAPDGLYSFVYCDSSLQSAFVEVGRVPASTLSESTTRSRLSSEFFPDTVVGRGRVLVDVSGVVPVVAGLVYLFDVPVPSLLCELPKEFLGVEIFLAKIC